MGFPGFDEGEQGGRVVTRVQYGFDVTLAGRVLKVEVGSEVDSYCHV